MDRETIEIEALRTDRYLEALLAETERPGADPTHPARRPHPPAGPPDPSVQLAARQLRRGLQRMHPSFRFEERLAVRLADLATTIATGGGEDRASALVLPFPFRPGQDPAGDEPGSASGAGPGIEPGARLPRPVLIGGAVASAAISIAGAAFVAWRLGRPVDPLAKAARAAHQLRVVAPGVIGPGGLG